MDINNLTIGQVKEISALFRGGGGPRCARLFLYWRNRYYPHLFRGGLVRNACSKGGE